jgi:hypothetical protein
VCRLETPAGAAAECSQIEFPRSTVHTCELNDVNAFDYLGELLRHAEELKQNPSAWMPWNYRETLARLVAPAAA